jgi:hypothetical protein
MLPESITGWALQYLDMKLADRLRCHALPGVERLRVLTAFLAGS